ncbi:helix-turn-helix domain-containing protein [Halosolutus amylolyticus]|uniref:Helix-turn-helix domain-containing protein n=1 Tax=Halosolutus amylolyticus TaxID=2932267 RepID=A0ABD5PNG0_9EURY|nr:helix-turn-helix domain-containing protein [Halosolutus amylolyticus]
MPATSVQQSTGGPETPPLRARLEVDPGPNANCPVVSAAPNAAAVTRSVSSGGSCHSEITVIDDGTCERSYVSSATTGDCVCGAISQFDCVFDVEAVTDGSLVISLVVEDRPLLSRIISALEETGATVRLQRLAHGVDDGDVTLEIDATDVTAKQREAVELAVELGYYDRPRTATLSELADRLGVSKSAVSQRLNAVELTLIRSFVTD